MKVKQTIEYQRALVYCRVSTTKQVIDGDGLSSQEHRCLQKAEELNLEVAKIFRDPAVSGGLFTRPAMTKLLEFLDDRPNEKFVIIFDDLKRFARDVQVHLLLKTELVQKRKVRLECLNFKFEESPTGRFIEFVMAAGAQLEREQNAEQVKNRMKARLEAGYWTFCPPPGLKFEKDPLRGKVLVPNEPLASIYKEAIEGYRDYQLNTLDAVRKFILNKYSVHGINRPLSLNGAKNILSNSLYCGRISFPDWNISEFQGQHQGFISYETYLAVQDKLASKAKPRLRKDYSPDFPLRGYVLCHECKEPMTSFWGKGNGGKYGYYKCKNESCVRKNKCIAKVKIEGDFEELLSNVKPKKELLDFASKILIDLWKERSDSQQEVREGLDKQISKLDLKNSSLMDRVSQTSDHTLINVYERALAKNAELIEDLEKEKAKIKYPQNGFQTALGVVTEYVGTPIKQWQSQDYRRQRLLLQMYFEDRIVYEPGLGLQTIQLPLILEITSKIPLNKAKMVEMPGVKPGSKTCSLFNYSQD
jgi:site-specific DNA recombinase